MLEILSLIILISLVFFVVYIAFQLGKLPGDIARKRHHPQAEAITILGWIGIVTLGLAWPVALVWAYHKPLPSDVQALREEVTALKQTVRDLETTLTTVRKEA